MDLALEATVGLISLYSLAFYTNLGSRDINSVFYQTKPPSVYYSSRTLPCLWES